MADTSQTVCWSFGAQSERSGHLYWPFEREHMEEVLWDSIRRLKLEQQIRAEFQVTKPLFYGLWIDSSLSTEQCSLLLAVFEDVIEQVPRSRLFLNDMIQALRQTVHQNEALHVALGPPGHVDLGWNTTFVHCPRCKAEGPFARWQDSYPVDPIACPICGHTYSPAATHRSEEVLFAESVQCGDCKQTFRVRDFSHTEIQKLEVCHQYRECCDDLRWMRRIEAFYRKYPELEDKIKPDFFAFLDTDDPNALVKMMEGVLIGEFPSPPPPLGLVERRQEMSPDELEVVEYLKVYSFSLGARKASVEKQLKELEPQVKFARVPCAICGGELQ